MAVLSSPTGVPSQTVQLQKGAPSTPQPPVRPTLPRRSYRSGVTRTSMRQMCTSWGVRLGSLVNLANSSFVGNVASNAGGAVYMSGDNQLVSQGNIFVASQAGAQGMYSMLVPLCLARALSQSRSLHTCCLHPDDSVSLVLPSARFD